MRPLSTHPMHSPYHSTGLRLFRKNRGFTLIEVTISMAILIILMAMLLIGFLGVFRLVNAEESLLSLDVNGDRAMWELSRELLPAIIPIKLDSVAEKTELGKLFNDKSRGFGEHGVSWRSVLRRGSDCLAYTVPVDYDGDGDCLDADSFPELGIVLPGDIAVAAAEYTLKGAANNNHLRGSIHPYLGALDPVSDLGLQTSDGEVDTEAPRFAAAFEFPDDADRAFGIVRFAPLYEGDKPVVVKEASVGWDFNEDGDMDDTYLLGHMEVVYPDAVRTVDIAQDIDSWTIGDDGSLRRVMTENVVLLQINQDDEGWEPIFKLVRYQSGTAAGNGAVYDDAAESDGLYAIRVRLLLHDPNYVPAGNNAVRVAARKYETLLKLRGMP